MRFDHESKRRVKLDKFEETDSSSKTTTNSVTHARGTCLPRQSTNRGPVDQWPEALPACPWPAEAASHCGSGSLRAFLEQAASQEERV